MAAAHEWRPTRDESLSRDSSTTRGAWSLTADLFLMERSVGPEPSLRGEGTPSEQTQSGAEGGPDFAGGTLVPRAARRPSLVRSRGVMASLGVNLWVGDAVAFRWNPFDRQR